VCAGALSKKRRSRSARRQGKTQKKRADDAIATADSIQRARANDPRLALLFKNVTFYSSLSGILRAFFQTHTKSL